MKSISSRIFSGLKMNFSSGGTETGWIDKYNHLMVELRDPRYPHYDENLS